MALDATPSGENSDSYVTLDEANTYHGARLFNDAWTAATDATKEASIKWATSMLDEYFEWVGSRASSLQALGWPRSNAESDGRVLSNLVVPTSIKKATSEFAFLLLSSDRVSLSEPSSQGLDSISVGPIELSFDDEERASFMPGIIKTMVGGLADNTSNIMVRIKRA